MGRGKQGGEVGGWGAGGEHFREDGVGVGGGALFAEGVAVVDPGVNDDFRAGVGPEEEAEAILAEFGAEPVAVLGA